VKKTINDYYYFCLFVIEFGGEDHVLRDYAQQEIGTFLFEIESFLSVNVLFVL